MSLSGETSTQLSSQDRHFSGQNWQLSDQISTKKVKKTKQHCLASVLPSGPCIQVKNPRLQALPPCVWVVWHLSARGCFQGGPGLSMVKGECKPFPITQTQTPSAKAGDNSALSQMMLTESGIQKNSQNYSGGLRREIQECSRIRGRFSRGHLIFPEVSQTLAGIASHFPGGFPNPGRSSISFSWRNSMM